MPLFQVPDQQTHHHGPLAGVSAGAMAVLVGGGVILLACRHQLGEVANWAAVALIVLLVAAVAYALAYGFLRLRLHARSPETLIRRPPVTAEVLDQEPAAIPPAQPVAELPAGGFAHPLPLRLRRSGRGRTAGDAGTADHGEPP